MQLLAAQRVQCHSREEKLLLLEDLQVLTGLRASITCSAAAAADHRRHKVCSQPPFCSCGIPPYCAWFVCA